MGTLRVHQITIHEKQYHVYDSHLYIIVIWKDGDLII